MERIELDIIDYGYDGEGVAKRDGQTYFIPKTIIGEKVEAEIVKEHKRFCECKLKKVTTKSPQRKIAPCAYYDQCGGCNYQHFDYKTELEIKQNLFLRELAKVISLSTVEIISSEKPYGYRNKIRFKVKNKKLGFYEVKSNNFLEVKRCLIAQNKLNDVLDLINEFLKESKYVFDEVIIYSFDKKVLVDFLTKDKINLPEIKNSFNFPIMVNHIGENIECEYFNLRYDFCGDSFRQVNDFVAGLLYEETLKRIEGKVVLNAFSGSGLLSGMISKKAKTVYGIELNENAHIGAESLKEKNKITNLINICGYVEKEMSNIKDKLDCVILDPPRAGCATTVLQFLVDEKINKIIYISCNPATLVRDLKILQNTYNIKEVKLFDMFPRTANLEAMVVLNVK